MVPFIENPSNSKTESILSSPERELTMNSVIKPPRIAAIATGE